MYASIRCLAPVATDNSDTAIHSNIFSYEITEYMYWIYIYFEAVCVEKLLSFWVCVGSFFPLAVPLEEFRYVIHVRTQGEGGGGRTGWQRASLPWQPDCSVFHAVCPCFELLHGRLQEDMPPPRLSSESERVRVQRHSDWNNKQCLCDFKDPSALSLLKR